MSAKQNDDFSGMIELYPSDTADADHVVKSLAEWLSRHDVPQIIVSDGARHFDNNVVRRIMQEYGIRHHIVAPYSPQANGTIEVLNRDILRLFRTLLSQKRLHEDNWTNVLDLVVTAVNMTPSSHRGGYSPFELYTGRAPRGLANALFNNATGLLDHPLDSAAVEQYIEDLRTHLAEVNANAADMMERRRLANRERHDQRHGVDFNKFHAFSGSMFY